MAVDTSNSSSLVLKGLIQSFCVLYRHLATKILLKSILLGNQLTVVYMKNGH